MNTLRTLLLSWRRLLARATRRKLAWPWPPSQPTGDKGAGAPTGAHNRFTLWMSERKKELAHMPSTARAVFNASEWSRLQASADPVDLALMAKLQAAATADKARYAAELVRYKASPKGYQLADAPFPTSNLVDAEIRSEVEALLRALVVAVDMGPDPEIVAPASRYGSKKFMAEVQLRQLHAPLRLLVMDARTRSSSLCSSWPTRRLFGRESSSTRRGRQSCSACGRTMGPHASSGVGTSRPVGLEPGRSIAARGSCRERFGFLRTEPRADWYDRDRHAARLFGVQLRRGEQSAPLPGNGGARRAGRESSRASGGVGKQRHREDAHAQKKA
ncbi:hypothetical protein T492DRAFT_956955 [Pavlovales sp. CCMP2436]|nr:hypothetical protein T492DRAFT_956955 [Pavlovales sp. CCMP2436]